MVAAGHIATTQTFVIGHIFATYPPKVTLPMGDVGPIE